MTVSEAQIRKIEKRLSSLEETVEIMADMKLLRSIKEALSEIRHGKYTDYKDLDELKAEFESEK